MKIAPKSNTESFSLTQARPLLVLPRFQEVEIVSNLPTWLESFLFLSFAGAACDRKAGRCFLHGISSRNAKLDKVKENIKLKKKKKGNGGAKRNSSSTPLFAAEDLSNTSRFISMVLVCKFAERKLTIDTAFDSYHYYIEKKRKKEKTKLIRLRREDVD